MRIIDAHHHFWDPEKNDHPWLRNDPMIPFRYGDYTAIRKPFMMNDYDGLAANWNIVASVTMEGEWNPEDPAGEAIWMQSVHEATGRPAAHVAQAWLDDKELPSLLETYSDLPIVRSVRHKPKAQPAPNLGVGQMTDPAFQAGFAALSRFNLAFDLQTPWWHLSDVPAMAKGAEDVQIILNHAGLPSDRTPDGLAAWRQALSEFAKLPQAVVKISGIGIAGKPWSLKDNRDIIRTVIDIFGPDRAMFASNFPVDGLCGSFNTIFSGFSEAIRDFSEPERNQLFFQTAATTYGLFNQQHQSASFLA